MLAIPSFCLWGHGAHGESRPPENAAGGASGLNDAARLK